MLLRAGYIAVAQKLQEAATAMSTDDVRTRLSDCLNDSYRGTGKWCYVVAVFGDDKSGDVVYSCNSDLKKAGYTISKGGAKIATDTAVDVQPLTTYETEAVEATEAGARNSKRDLRQLQTIHDSAAALGANCSMAEAHRATESAMKLVESAETLETIVLKESRADYEIKLIAPGKGSSAFYPAEVLKRDGPGVFKAGTHVYLNHATAAEEAARPEGDVKNLAGVLTTAAVYHEAHAKGPGLYGRMKVFADHATLVEEKAAHVGMSIRAAGIAEAGRKQEGLPILKELTRAESVDVVTRAGAGGMILTEAAKPQIQQEESAMAEATMTKEDIQKLVESAVAAAVAAVSAPVAGLTERALRGDAMVAAQKILAPLALQESSKSRVIERAVPVKDGALDLARFTEAVNAQAKVEGEYVASLTGAGRVIGMGSAPPADPAAETKMREAAARSHKRAVDVFSEFGLPADAVKAIASGYGEAA